MEESFKVIEEIKNVANESQSEESKETKYCRRCGRVLPISHFSKNSRTKDGLQIYCKDCQAVLNKNRREEKKEEEEASKRTPKTPEGKAMLRVYANPDLARFTPRQLMEELKARGFVWDYMLEPQRKIQFDKI